MNFISNVDTIYILVDTEDYENKNNELLQYLQHEKEKAQLLCKDNASYKHIININDMNFEIMSIGARGFSFILQNSGYQIYISQYKSKLKSFMPIKIRISSEYLWAFGLEHAWAIIYNWIVEIFGNIISEKVCRLDLCAHASGIDLISDYQNTYKGNFRKSEAFYTGKNINAITFGKRTTPIYCRIYNKTLEIQEKRQKIWFIDIWKRYNLDIKNVWNIEFEIKSELLRKFSIDTVSQVLEHLQDLWLFCTEKWLVKVDKTSTRIERCKTNVEWLEIQKSYSQFKMIGLIEKQKQLESDALSLVPNIVGTMTSYSARKGIIEMDKAFETFKRDARRYFHSKTKTFEEAVREKILLLGGDIE